MNDSRRLQLAQQHIRLIKLITDLQEICKDEEYAIDEIKSEERKEIAEEGIEHLNDLIDLLNDGIDLFEEAAQGNYNYILAKEQRRQVKVREEKKRLKLEQQLK